MTKAQKSVLADIRWNGHYAKDGWVSWRAFYKKQVIDALERKGKIAVSGDYARARGYEADNEG